MTEVIVAPDGETLIEEWLTQALVAQGRPAHVGTAVPDDRSHEFVRVLSVSSSPRTNRVVQPWTFILEAWSGLESASMSLALLCQALLLSMPDSHDLVSAADIPYPVNLPDPESAQHRYTMTGSLTLIASAI